MPASGEELLSIEKDGLGIIGRAVQVIAGVPGVGLCREGPEVPHPELQLKPPPFTPVDRVYEGAVVDEQSTQDRGHHQRVVFPAAKL